MLTVDEYGRLRRAHRDGMSIREIARTFRHSRRKVRQVLAEPEPKPVAATSDTFGDVIDVGEGAAPEIVEVPEADAPQPRRRERVRKPATAVLAEVPTPAKSADTDEAEDPAPGAPAKEPGGEAEPDRSELMGADDAEPSEGDHESGPKRRGWWSRALGGS